VLLSRARFPSLTVLLRSTGVVVTKTVCREQREERDASRAEEKEEEKTGEIQIVPSNGQATARIRVKEIAVFAVVVIATSS